MIVDRLFERRSVKVAARERQPRRNRAFRFLFISLGSGAIAALLAIVIAGVPTVLSFVFPQTPPTIEAAQLFPPVPVQHKVVTVYDPPQAEPAWPSSTAGSRPQPTAEPTEPGDAGEAGGGGDN